MFVCKSISLANFLISNGSNVIRIDKDKTSNKHIVFLFDNNDLLNKNMKKWSNKFNSIQ